MLFCIYLSVEPVELRVAGGDGEIISVEQGKKFAIAFECVTSEGQVVSLGKKLVIIEIHSTFLEIKVYLINNIIINTLYLRF